MPSFFPQQIPLQKLSMPCGKRSRDEVASGPGKEVNKSLNKETIETFYIFDIIITGVQIRKKITNSTFKWKEQSSRLSTEHHVKEALESNEIKEISKGSFSTGE